MPKKVKVPPIRRPEPSVRVVEGRSAAKVLQGIRDAMKSEFAGQTLGEAVKKRQDYRLTGWVESGIWAIDYLLGDFRGVPLGVNGTIMGDEATGKSALTQFLMRCFQEAGGTEVYFDFDGDLQSQRLGGYGINLDNVIVPEVDTIEEAFDCIAGAFTNLYGKHVGPRRRKKESKSSGPPLLCIFDSIAAAGTKARVNAGSAEDVVIGRKALVLSEQNENLRRYIRGRPASVIFINELREDIGANARFGRQLKMPGGRSLRYMSRWMLKLARGKPFRDKDNHVLGFPIWASTLKSSYGQPYSTEKFYLSAIKGPHGGPHPAKSNWMFLKEHAMLGAKGDKGVFIRGLKDEVGVFAKADWPDVMKSHKKKIKAMLVERLSERSAVSRDSEEVVTDEE